MISTIVQPVISPAGTISEIFRYELKGPPEMDLIELKTLQDWVVERRLRMVPGVSDVLVLGGKTKEFQAEIDLTRMRAFGVSIPQIINAIATNNANVGGRTIAMGEQAVSRIGIGLDVERGKGHKAQAEKRRERDQHERAPQQAEGNQATQHSASIGSAIDSPQIGQRHGVESNRAVRRMGMSRKDMPGRHCAGVGNNSAEARGRRSPFVGAASSGPMVWIRRCSCRGYAMSVHGQTRHAGPLVGVAGPRPEGPSCQTSGPLLL
jgi:AcrB/AcrD/AcrF family protein